MVGLIALVVLAIVAALALRRVRDRVLTGVAMAGLVLLSIPAVLINGDIAERVVAAIFVYAPYWEYLVPLAFFILALLPKSGKNKTTKKRQEKYVVTV
ncbi:MAG: hypothetical protein QXK71_03320 [Pyrobaculum sp.]|jgi:uncharacterized membrane protein YhaH (DUF805 family)